MFMYYDITNPDASYDWLLDTLQIKGFEFIDSYVIECHSDSDEFCEKYSMGIEQIDIENLEMVAFQVTTSSDECAEIKKYGLRNLQWVLSNDTNLCRFLKDNNISFDIENRLLYIGDTAYDIDYEKYRNLDMISRRNEQLHNIGHKIYYDFQINAFMFHKDIYEYSTICQAPEFLYTLSSLNKATKDIDTKWKDMCKTYVVKFKCKLKDLAYFTFYGSEEEYNEDRQENWGRVKRTLITSAAERALGNNTSEAFAYMKPDVAIAPENILDYVPAEKWRKDVLKYFGKE